MLNYPAPLAQQQKRNCRSGPQSSIDDDILVGAEHKRSHHIAYRLPYTSSNMMVIHPGWQPYTVVVYFNKDYIEPEIANIIIKEFLTLLNKYNFDVLILTKHDGITSFFGTDAGSKRVAEILSVLGPLWGLGKGYKVKFYLS